MSVGAVHGQRFSQAISMTVYAHAPILTSVLQPSALECAWLCAEISAKIGNPCSPLDRRAQENVSLVRGLAVFMRAAFIWQSSPPPPMPPILRSTICMKRPRIAYSRRRRRADQYGGYRPRRGSAAGRGAQTGYAMSRGDVAPYSHASSSQNPFAHRR